MKLLVSVFTMCLAFSVTAGVKEKKMLQELDDAIKNDVMGAVKSAVGKDVAYELKVEPTMTVNQMRIAKEQFQKRFVPMFKEVAADKDYLEEIKKITKFVFDIRGKLEKTSSTKYLLYTGFTKNGTVLEILADGTHDMSNNDAGKFKNYFESIW